MVLSITFSHLQKNLTFIFILVASCFFNNSYSQCLLSNLKIEKTACTADKTFYVAINFSYQGNSECFTIKGNGVNYGTFKYSQLPLKLGPLKGNCETEYEFVIRDCVTEKCSLTHLLGKVCCEAPVCALTEMNIIRSDCNADGNFYATIKFNYKNTSECFNLVGNGIKYGSFKYSQLPIKIGPLKGDCKTDYEFTAYDCLSEKCNISKNLGIICCEQNTECKIYDLEFTKSSCDTNGEFLIKFNFKYQNTSDSFNIFDENKKFLGRFSFAKQPIIAGPFKGDCKTNHILVLRDYKNEKCALEKEIGIVCCEQNQECKLEGLKIEKSECNEEKQFYAILNFNYKNTSECFTVTGNGVNYGTFNYANLPIKIGPLKGDCETNYGFVIRDCKNEKCVIEGELGKVCCENENNCELYDLKYEKTGCNENKEFYINLKFNYKNTSECFKIYGNGINYGLFEYNELPIKIGPLKGNCETNYEFVIQDCENENCKLILPLGKVCCENNSNECMLSGLKIIKTSCTADKNFFTYLNFQHKNTSECFTITGNGINYGTFKYSQLPLKLGPHKGNCETNYEFVIRDCKNEKCSIGTNIGKVCCEGTGNGTECNISELNLNRTECNEDGTFYIKLNFSHKNTSECFILRQNDIIINKYQYKDLPLEIGPFKGDCKTEYIFSVTDCLNEKCASKKLLGKVCCETQGNCEMGDLQVTKSECDKEGNFKVKLNFKYANVSECFVLVVNGKPVSKNLYSMLPLELGPFPGDCKTEYTFSVYDCNNEKCTTKASLGKVCCETNTEDCKLSNLKFERSECNEEKNFYVYFNFDHQNTSDCFTVTGSGLNHGTFKYSDLPIKIGPLKGNCETEYEFVIQDCEHKECSLVKELGKVCCETQNNCMLDGLQLSKSECDKEGNFKVKLDFKYANVSECFVLVVNGKPISKYTYSMLPLELGPYPGDCKTEYNFLVYDCNNEKCYTKASIGKVCCESQNGDCKLGELKIEKTPCEADKTFYAIINFAHVNTSDCFIVTGNGVKYGSFMYSQLPIKIGPLKANCETEYEFVIRDCENEKCITSGVLGKVCCEGQNLCSLDSLVVSRVDCNAEGNFLVKINFKYKNVSECFVVRQNNNILGKFKYSQLPLQLGPFKGDCTTNYTFTISDCISEKCNIRKEIGRVCCKPVLNTCMLSDLKYEKTTCNENKELYLIVKLIYKNTSECFTASINGKLLGTFEYKNLPIKIGPIKADCETKYNLVIRDCKSEKCALEYAIGTICCEKLGAACEISKLEAKALECTGNGQYAVKINFSHTGTKGVGFDVFDQNGKSLGFYSYSSLPLTLREFKASGNELDYLKVCENDNEKCCAEVKFSALKCLKGNPGGFIIDQVELRYSNDHIILFSENSFPEYFDYLVHDINGRALNIEEAYRDQHNILIPITSLENGMYIINMQHSYNLRNMKFIK